MQPSPDIAGFTSQDNGYFGDPCPKPQRWSSIGESSWTTMLIMLHWHPWQADAKAHGGCRRVGPEPQHAPPLVSLELGSPASVAPSVIKHGQARSSTPVGKYPVLGKGLSSRDPSWARGDCLKEGVADLSRIYPARPVAAGLAIVG